MRPAYASSTPLCLKQAAQVAHQLRLQAIQPSSLDLTHLHEQAIQLLSESLLCCQARGLNNNIDKQLRCEQAAMPCTLAMLADDALERILQRLALRDFASLAACSKDLRALVASQPESVWKLAAAGDPGALGQLNAGRL